MCQRLAGVALVDAYALWGVIVPGLQKIFVLSRAGAERDEKCSGVEDSARALLDQVVTLLRHQTRNDCDNRSLRFFRKAESAQEIELTFTLTVKIINGEVRRAVRIGFGIPDFIIDPVRNSRQSIATGSYQPLESIALFRRLNFTRITRADRRKRIGSDNAGLQSRGCALEHEIAGNITESEPPQV